MDLGLAGKVAWVTGGSSGLGRAAATSLAREGARVAISARRTDVLRAAATEIADTTGGTCIAVPADVSDAAAVGRAATTVSDDLGPIDILVANSGGPPAGRFESLDDPDLHTGWLSTAASAWHLAKAVVEPMRQRGGGCLVFITSTSTKEIIENLLLSNMVRPAVVGMSKTLSKELGPNGIRTICVAPGRIETPRLLELHEVTAQRSGSSVADVRAAGRAAIPLGRFGRPEEVGDVIAFLASDRASYITGVTVTVDGGLLFGQQS
jgi:3-oxoacyl-[acyl-carrier protein] reductase